MCISCCKIFKTPGLAFPDRAWPVFRLDPILGVKIKLMLLLHLDVNTVKMIFLCLGIKIGERLCLCLLTLSAVNIVSYDNIFQAPAGSGQFLGLTSEWGLSRDGYIRLGWR